MQRFFRPEYHPLDESKTNLSSIADEENEFLSPSTSSIGAYRNLLALFLVVSNIGIFGFSVFFFLQSRQDRSFEGAAETRTGYPPLLKAVASSPKTTLLEGSFWSNSSIFRQDPSPSVDEAWDRIAGTYIIAVPSSAIKEAGKDPSTIVKAPQSWGVGDDAYPVDIDAFHQVHCLNALRKDIFYDYYYGSLERSKFYLAHRAHCIHILLQNLMCKADVDLITMNWVHKQSWVDPAEKPWPDFNVAKKCRNFEALIDWAVQNEVPNAEEKRVELRMPAGGSVNEFHDV